jgi:hypothetical protein
MTDGSSSDIDSETWLDPDDMTEGVKQLCDHGSD